MAQTVAGFVPFTSIDYPNHLAAVIFFQGCPLRCPFCHNPNLQPICETKQDWSEILDFLKNRRGRLDGVVFSGGEPLIQKDLFILMQQVKELGFLIALHTAGVNPKELEHVLPLIDWVGLDVKAPWDKYDLLTGRKNLAEKVQDTIKILVKNGLSFECRTTCDPTHLLPKDIIQIAHTLKQLGVQQYALQKYHSFPEDKNPPSVTDIEAFFTPQVIDKIKMLYPKIILR